MILFLLKDFPSNKNIEESRVKYLLIYSNSEFSFNFSLNKFKYSERLTANKKNFLKTVNETIPLFISEVLCKKYFIKKNPFSNNYEELTSEPLNSYIYTSSILCEIRENLIQALQVVEDGLKLYPNFYMLLVNKSIILSKLYRFSDALKTLKKGIKYFKLDFNENEENYKIELINLLKLKMSLSLMNNDYDGAFRIYKKLSKLDPSIISYFIFIKYDRSNQEFSPHQSTVSKLFNEDLKKQIESNYSRIKNLTNEHDTNDNIIYFTFQYKQKLTNIEQLALYLYRMKAFSENTAVKINMNLPNLNSLLITKNFHKIDGVRYYLTEESKQTLLQAFRKIRFHSGIFNLSNFLYLII